MTMRTCFYPLLGERVFGIIGDIIDIMSVVATMFGVCTSLGLGAIQLNAGKQAMSYRRQGDTSCFKNTKLHVMQSIF